MYFFACFVVLYVLSIRGVCGAVWFGFEAKSHMNHKIKKHAVWLGLVRLTFKAQSEPNQTKQMRFGLDQLV